MSIDQSVRPYGSSHPDRRPTAPDNRWVESHSEHPEDQPDAEWPAPRPGWVILSVFSALAVLAIIGGIAGYAYDWGESQLETPVILADSSPIMSQPESPGGLDVPNQNAAVLTDGEPDHANSQVERLLPSPETLLPPQTESVETEATTEPEALALAGPPLETAPDPAEKLLSESESPLASAPQIAAVPEPPPASAAAAAASLPEQPAAPSAATSAKTPAAMTAPPTASLPAPSETPALQVAALPPATTPAGPYVVQLAALKSQDGARPAWGRLQKAHTAFLSERELAIQEIDLGERGIFYRVQAGYFPDRASALELCTALKARGQDCLVVKR